MPNMETVCKNCVFALYEQNTQTGCFFNRIEKYKKQGVNVVEAEDENQVQFYVIEERLCLACRDKSWATNYPNHSLKELADLTRTQISMRTEALIFVDDLEKFEHTVKTLLEQQKQPSCIVGIVRQGYLQPAKVQKILSTTPNWRFSVVNDDNRDTALDFTVNKCQAPCFAVFNNGYPVPANFFSNIDVALNDDLERFIMLKPDSEGNGFWTQTKLYQRLRKDNQLESFEQQITNLAKLQKCDYLLKSSEELWKK